MEGIRRLCALSSPKPLLYPRFPPPQVVAPFDHGWCFTYSCSKRISNYHTYLPSNTVASISMRGSPPKFARLWWPYADPSAELVVSIDYQGLPNRKFVWLDEAGRVEASPAPPRIGDGQSHGAFFWDRWASQLWVKMTGGRSLEVRTDNAIEVSATLSMSVDDFYDNQVREPSTTCDGSMWGSHHSPTPSLTPHPPC